MSKDFPRFRRRISVRYYRNSGVRRAMKSASSRRALAAAELITIYAWYSSLILPHSTGIVPIATAGWDAAEGKVNACRFPAETGGTGDRGAVAPVIPACQSSSWSCWVRLVSANIRVRIDSGEPRLKQHVLGWAVIKARCDSNAKRGHVPTCRTTRRWTRLLLAASVIAVLGLVPVGAAVADDTMPAASTAADPNAARQENTPFTGNVELKARLDAPGSLVIAGQRVHLALLRRFYIAHGYQTVWDTRPAEAKRLRDAVLQADNHGLDPGLFHGSLFGERGQSLSPVERDLVLSDAFLSYADALSRG